MTYIHLLRWAHCVHVHALTTLSFVSFAQVIKSRQEAAHAVLGTPTLCRWVGSPSALEGVPERRLPMARVMYLSLMTQPGQALSSLASPAMNASTHCIMHALMLLYAAGLDCVSLAAMRARQVEEVCWQ